MSLRWRLAWKNEPLDPIRTSLFRTQRQPPEPHDLPALLHDPAADWLVICGSEWSVLLTNSSGLTKSVPTDQVEASYPHWQKTFAAGCLRYQTTPCNIAPHFGGLNLTCNQSDATFQLQTADGQSFLDGLLLVTIAGGAAGRLQNYCPTSWQSMHRNAHRERGRDK